MQEPVVNPLIKAIIEHDYASMDNLYTNGARLSSCHEETLQVALFYSIDDYRTMSWVIDHGLYGRLNARNARSDWLCRECVDSDGYSWDLLSRAWFVDAYDVMELLIERGLGEQFPQYCMRGVGFKLLYQMFKQQDIKGVRLLRAHGYQLKPWDPSVNHYNLLKEEYPNSLVVCDIENHPLVTRKGFGMDVHFLTAARGSIKAPKLRQVRFLHRKEDQRWNELESADYADRVRAQKEFSKRLALYQEQIRRHD